MHNRSPVHTGMNAEQTWTCHHVPHSRILPPAHVAYTWDTLTGQFARLPGSKQMLIPLFLPASLFTFNLFPPCHQCSLAGSGSDYIPRHVVFLLGICVCVCGFCCFCWVLLVVVWSFFCLVRFGLVFSIQDPMKTKYTHEN